eukprot:469001-Alexandrium_andersonii.AAC.1
MRERLHLEFWGARPSTRRQSWSPEPLARALMSGLRSSIRDSGGHKARHRASAARHQRTGSRLPEYAGCCGG